MTDSGSQEHEIRQRPTFKEVLLQSAFAKGRGISDKVRDIDLGVFAEESRNLVSQMTDDPAHKEFGKLVYVTKGGKILLQNQATVGDERSVTHPFRAQIQVNNPSLPWFMRQDRICGSTLHTHPEDIPPSSEDLLDLLVGDFDYGLASSVFVATAKRNFVIFRGNNTPQFTREQAKEKIALWEKLIKERVENFTNPYMPMPEQLEINNRARTALLRQIGQKYGLKVFIGGINSNQVSLY